MKFQLRFVLILTALIAAALLVLAVACGGDEEEAPAAAETPAAAEETPELAPGEETPEKPPTGEEGELPAIPTYPGAEEIETATWTGTGVFPIPLMGDEGPAPEEYGTVQFTVYETSDSPEKVIDFYKDEFKGWKEEFTFSLEQVGEKGGVVVWSKDDGNIAAWLGAFEDDGTTGVVVAMGARQ
jgi:hypothetical protein